MKRTITRDKVSKIVSTYVKDWFNPQIISTSSTRGLFAGGVVEGYTSKIIDYITIETLGNSSNFGDLSSARYNNLECSNGHGGL